MIEKTDAMEEKLIEICQQVQCEWSMGGLSDGLYGDYAKEVARRALAARDAQADERGERQSFPERDATKTNAEQGLYRKFEVRRVDGSDALGGKHHGCEYFVLDMTHDHHAPAALRAYAQSCASTHPHLSADLMVRFGGERQGTLSDTFQGDDAQLVSSIEALLALDAEGALAPHGIGGHARILLSAAAVRLAASAPTLGEKAEAMRDAAMRTVQAMGYEYTGGGRWKPSMTAPAVAQPLTDEQRRVLREIGRYQFRDTGPLETGDTP